MDSEKETKYAQDLEKMIDDRGLSKLLGDIAQICCEKSDHIAVNWQDYDLAELWGENGTKIQECSESVSEPS